MCPIGYGRKERGKQWKDGSRASGSKTLGNKEITQVTGRT